MIAHCRRAGGAFTPHSPRGRQPDRQGHRRAAQTGSAAAEAAASPTKENEMKLLKLSGLAVIAGLLLVVAPGERAQAAPMTSQGLAAAVQRDVIPEATEVHYRRHAHRHHHRWHRHHHVRRYYGHPHHYRHHHHHRRHWR
jgi:hypothetical protein